MKSSSQDLVTDAVVPVANSYDLGKRPFMSAVRDAKAGTQITGAFASTGRALVKRNRSIFRSHFWLLYGKLIEVPAF